MKSIFTPEDIRSHVDMVSKKARGEISGAELSAYMGIVKDAVDHAYRAKCVCFDGLHLRDLDGKRFAFKCTCPLGKARHEKYPVYDPGLEDRWKTNTWES